jgi:probable rRNA maturation factor
MEIAIDVRCDETLPPADDIRGLCEFALAHENAPDNVEVSLSFVGVEEIAELNGAYRHKEGPTDVLSFPMDDVDSDEAAAEDTIPIGDIVIAPAVAAAQAPTYDSTFDHEMELLLVHGILHLLGYDHIEDEEAEIMEAHERDILNAWRS